MPVVTEYQHITVPVIRVPVVTEYHERVWNTRDQNPFEIKKIFFLILECHRDLLDYGNHHRRGHCLYQKRLLGI
jgi:hypothetical protein